MPLFICMHSTYDYADIAVAHEQGILNTVRIDKTGISKEWALIIKQLLTAHQCALEDLSFIAANQGPGPFTTLRTILTCANGLAFASTIPLVGVNALEILVETHVTNNKVTIALLNAFGKDVYVGYRADDGAFICRAESIDHFVAHIKNELPGKEIECVGNGTQLYREILLAHGFHVPTDVAPYSTVEQMADAAHKKWLNGEKSSELMPLYLKNFPG